MKVIATRKGCSIAEAVYLYNITPLDDCSSSSAPANVLYKYSVRVREEEICSESDSGAAGNPHQAGEEVWVKPHGVRCDRPYNEGVVTRVVSDQVAEVDGIPRHIRNLRPRISPRCQDQESSTPEDRDKDLLVTFCEQETPQPEQVFNKGDEDAGEWGLRCPTRTKTPQQCLLCD